MRRREHEHDLVEEHREVDALDGRVTVRERCSDPRCGWVELRYIEPPLGEDGICRRRTRYTDVVGLPCPTCGHSGLVHPGEPTDKRGTLAACPVCELGKLIERSKT